MRITLSIDPETAQRLQELAGSPRKQGDYVSSLVNAAWENRRHGAGVSMERLRLQVVGLAAEVQDLRGRLLHVERSGPSEDF